MPTYTAADASCTIFTYKEGLLAKAAHDLKLAANQFTVELSEGNLRAEFQSGAIEVVCAMENGREAPGKIGRWDKGKIQGNLKKDVLNTKRHPSIVFQSKSIEREEDRATIVGDLTLCGRTKELRITAQKNGSNWSARVRIHQPDFGIKPFSAALGTIKIQPALDVEITLPAQ